MAHAVRGLEASKSGRVRWGLVLVRTNAAGATLFAGYVWQANHNSLNCTGCALPILMWVVISVAIIGAWLAAWAWSRQRWIIASVGFFFSLAFPWGYFAVPSVPVVLGLTTVAIKRAVEGRRRPADGS